MTARIHITGASCTGVTSLGAALARHLNVPLLDCDSYYWLPTSVPFSQKRPPEDRVTLIHNDQGEGPWILSGSLMGWGEPALRNADLTVFLSAPWPVRKTRLIAREAARFGTRIQPGGDMHQIHLDFLDWAARYDDPTFHGRNRSRHEAWLADLSMPVLRLDGCLPIDDLVVQTCDRLTQLGLETS